MAIRVVVIEDNPANLELMTYLLRAYKFEPLPAVSGEEGVETVLRERPDLVLCDIQLPKMDGFEVLRRLKAEPGFERIPIVAVTAFAMVGDKERMLTAGFDGYIGKPITPDTFVGQVERFIRARQSLPASPMRAKHAGARILMVDNTAANRDLVYSILEPAGYQVAISSNVAAAIERARAIRPDLIISDIHMPGADGFELLVSIKADPELRDVPFVFSTASLGPEFNRQKALALGATGFLEQPVEPQSLLDAVEKLIDQARGGADGNRPDRR